MTAHFPTHDPIGEWFHEALITPNNFVHKSLSSFSLNTTVGCMHGCGFCYVPSASVNKLAKQLLNYGITNPDSEWGQYALLRVWNEKKFLRSLRAAEDTPLTDLKPDGNRAVMLCTTTDPYQVFRHSDREQGKELTRQSLALVARALTLIRDESTLNVRIMTRSPLAREHFSLFKSFGSRLLFGMSIPTLRNDLASIYEPHAPAPSVRLATLRQATEQGIPVYVAMAPTYPECDEPDLRRTMSEFKDLGACTIFHEPINIRAENVERIEQQARMRGLSMRTDVFKTREAWKNYALESLMTVERLAHELGIADRLHLWPDKSLGAKWVIESMQDPEKHTAWLHEKWARISEWPSQRATQSLGASRS